MMRSGLPEPSSLAETHGSARSVQLAQIIRLAFSDAPVGPPALDADATERAAIPSDASGRRFHQQILENSGCHDHARVRRRGRCPAVHAVADATVPDALVGIQMPGGRPDACWR